MELKVNVNVIIASKEDVNLLEDVLIKLGNGEFNVGSISTQNISSVPTSVSQPVQEIQNVVPITPVQSTAPVQTAQNQPVQTAVPTTAKTYTLEDLQRASGALVQAGKIQQLQGLLQQFNAVSLAHLAQENFGAFALKLRELGADVYWQKLITKNGLMPSLALAVLVDGRLVLVACRWRMGFLTANLYMQKKGL